MQADAVRRVVDQQEPNMTYLSPLSSAIPQQAGAFLRSTGRGRAHEAPPAGYNALTHLERASGTMRRTVTGSLAGALLGAVLAAAPARAATTAPATRPGAVATAKAKADERLEAILAGGVPKSAEEIRAMERRFREVAEKVTPATVGISSRGGGGSGVIVSKDGLVLTVGHVTREAGRDVTVLLPDGRRARAKTLGANLAVDAGMVQITDKPDANAPWPLCPMGKSGDLRPGQWVLAAGHPGGFRRGRTPPVRVGRVLRSSSRSITTDCTIVSGDSGGPTFDMAGRVIGISSRISGALDGNIHVPIDAFHADWERLKKGEVFDPRRTTDGGAYLGVMAGPETDDLRIGQVIAGSAAENAGMKPGDVVLKLAGKPVPDWATLVRLIRERKPGDKVKIVVRRGKKTVTLDATLGRR